ncbi:MAG: hypothetical protein IKL04_08640 [Lachnospiraceae bacterium]|nr:hypothetical protein [Lachnospiraceae bacterium]
MKKIGKEVLWSLITGVAGSALILFQTLAGNPAHKTIVDFFVITMIVPVVTLLISGMLMGRKNKLGKILPYFLIVTASVFGVTVFSMFHMYESGAIWEMLANTKTSDNIVLEINNSVTMGTVMQQLLICAVCTWLGTTMGGKMDGMLSKIRN